MYESRIEQDIVIPMLGYLALGLPFVLLERLWPVRDVPLRRVLLRDLGACLLVFIVGTFADQFSRYVLNHHVHLWDYFRNAPHYPLWVVIPAMLVGTDFTLYWVHRAMHSRLLWPTHRWHHSPSQLYWLAGIRASFLHNALYGASTTVWFVALNVPGSLFMVIAVTGVLANHWMHANIKLNTRWMEWLLVTPRTHAIHHSRAPEHHDRNFGAFFGCWDRLFGTYVDPDTVGALEFGVPDPVSLPRYVVGV
jgi:sterol desaturase/sphingolipid hydroxylase (fatty acid hydroxylase superfamily)